MIMSIITRRNKKRQEKINRKLPKFGYIKRYYCITAISSKDIEKHIKYYNYIKEFKTNKKYYKSKLCLLKIKGNKIIPDIFNIIDKYSNIDLDKIIFQNYTPSDGELYIKNLVYIFNKLGITTDSYHGSIKSFKDKFKLHFLSFNYYYGILNHSMHLKSEYNYIINNLKYDNIDVFKKDFNEISFLISPVTNILSMFLYNLSHYLSNYTINSNGLHFLEYFEHEYYIESRLNKKIPKILKKYIDDFKYLNYFIFD